MARKGRERKRETERAREGNSITPSPTLLSFTAATPPAASGVAAGSVAAGAGDIVSKECLQVTSGVACNLLLAFSPSREVKHWCSIFTSTSSYV